MKNPFFTVVIPVYNKVHYLTKAVDSVLNQTFKDFEIVLIDDNSSDGSDIVIDSVIDVRVRKLKRTIAGPGGYAARNLGISCSRGEYVTFLDADDTWLPNRLEILWDIINANPGMKVFTSVRKIISHSGVSVDKGSRKLASYSSDLLILDAREYIFIARRFSHILHPNTVAIRSDLAKSIGNLFPEGKTNRNGDVIAWIRLVLRAGSVVWVNSVATILDKRVPGVASSSVPKLEYYKEFFKTECHLLTVALKKDVAKYINSLIVTAWLQNYEYNNKVKFVGFYLIWNGCVFNSIRSTFSCYCKLFKMKIKRKIGR